ncbi:hypothetical protein DERP_011395 [Dermatophagoides pteronyssinus]|uniref:Uncharacterized protein n=2 Tax=Dermatophagoides pteronyssinus TaxID=6956 RepID=A0ABQ8J576_DERPT|nr:uncharacterized protein LOC113792760 [Dermatophagoides pteronyssinus]KAH9417684.1 hypothetical protein DERP_011395 [Dermatophagoides pteronyssinus]
MNPQNIFENSTNAAIIPLITFDDDENQSENNRNAADIPLIIFDDDDDQSENNINAAEHPLIIFDDNEDHQYENMDQNANELANDDESILNQFDPLPPHDEDDLPWEFHWHDFMEFARIVGDDVWFFNAEDEIMLMEDDEEEIFINVDDALLFLDDLDSDEEFTTSGYCSGSQSSGSSDISF